MGVDCIKDIYAIIFPPIQNIHVQKLVPHQTPMCEKQFFKSTVVAVLALAALATAASSSRLLPRASPKSVPPTEITAIP